MYTGPDSVYEVEVNPAGPGGSTFAIRNHTHIDIVISIIVIDLEVAYICHINIILLFGPCRHT